MPLGLGTRLGPYEVIALLGAGGMGEVYKGRDTRLERTVALKVLPTRVADDPGLRQRLEREARAVSSLNHPNICALYDIGRQVLCGHIGWTAVPRQDGRGRHRRFAHDRRPRLAVGAPPLALAGGAWVREAALC
jgi:hypothetical protein